MSQPDSFVYFAYGSNMLTRRLRERTPSARVIGAATLAGFELRWHKVSKDGSAKCDIVRSVAAGACVHGVLFEIALHDKPALDLAEGIGMGYREERVQVDGTHGAVEAWTYRATNIDPLALPYTWYKAIVVAGAREHGLPAGYVDALDAVRTKVDPRPERTAQNMQMVEAPAASAHDARPAHPHRQPQQAPQA